MTKSHFFNQCVCILQYFRNKMNIFTFGSSRSRCRLNDGKCAECNETGSQNVVAGLFHKFLSILIPVVFPVFLR